MAKMSPTQLSLRKLRNDGYKTVQVVEHWVHFSRTRRDLFNCIDILAIKDGEVLAVQTTTWGNRLARCRKIADNEHIGEMRKANWTIHVHGWRKEAGKWVLTTEDVS